MKIIFLILLNLSVFYCSSYGIDVSVWQGSIDWSAVASSKAFAFIRSSYGVTADSTFATNWANSQSSGISVGPYHYFEPGDDPTAQAQNFCNTVGSLQNLPPVIDCEVSGGLSASEYASNVLTWLQYVQNYFGVTPMIYTAPYFGNTYLNSASMAAYPLWVANYGVSSPSIPGQWGSYAYWQYSSTGSVSGISGNVDLDVSA